MILHSEWWQWEGKKIKPNDGEDAIKFAKRMSKLAFNAASESRKETSALIAEEYVCGCGRAECLDLDIRAGEIADSIREDK